MADWAIACYAANGHIDLPCIVRDVDLLFSVRGFREAEENGYFDFEINPKGT